MSEDSSDLREKAFLEELSALSRKHGLFIVGCGCCGSPWIDTKESLVSERRRQYSGGEGEHYITAGGTELTWEHKDVESK